jgi:hypothetical protein
MESDGVLSAPSIAGGLPLSSNAAELITSSLCDERSLEFCKKLFTDDVLDGIH